MKFGLILVSCLLLCVFVVLMTYTGGAALIFNALYLVVVIGVVLALISFVIGPF